MKCLKLYGSILVLSLIFKEIKKGLMILIFVWFVESQWLYEKEEILGFESVGTDYCNKRILNELAE